MWAWKANSTTSDILVGYQKSVLYHVKHFLGGLVFVLVISYSNALFMQQWHCVCHSSVCVCHSSVSHGRCGHEWLIAPLHASVLSCKHVKCLLGSSCLVLVIFHFMQQRYCTWHCTYQSPILPKGCLSWWWKCHLYMTLYIPRSHPSHRITIMAMKASPSHFVGGAQGHICKTISHFLLLLYVVANTTALQSHEANPLVSLPIGTKNVFVTRYSYYEELCHNLQYFPSLPFPCSLDVPMEPSGSYELQGISFCWQPLL